MSRADLSILPSSGVPVEASDDAGFFYLVQVEEQAGGLLSVHPSPVPGPPVDADADPDGIEQAWADSNAFTPPPPGTTFYLTWTVGRTCYRMPVQVREGAPDGSSQWTLAVIGEAEPFNRRRFVRGGGGEQALVSRVDGPDREPVLAQVVDLSEASICCRVPAEAMFAPGLQAWVDVRLPGQAGAVVIDTVGTVVSARDVGDGRKEIVVAYEPDEAFAKPVRQYIFERQMAERRTRRNVA